MVSRKRQKGLECVIDGCTEWRVSNDLCPKHNMQRYRRTESGKASTKKVNKRYKRPDIAKVCEDCKKDFVTARESQVLCSDCSGGSKAQYNAQKKHREKHPERARARDIINKRIKRGTLNREPCVACGKGAESHHPDYSKPLYIIWMCKEDHDLMHSLDYLFN